MMRINKGNPPRLLVAYQAQPEATFDGANFTPVKSAIREALDLEQHGLCAYCMRRIFPSETAMKVEHFRSRSEFPDDQLKYSNLIGCCLGNEGSSRKDQTCDTRKGDQELSFNPADPDPNVEAFISYSSDGRITSTHAKFNREIGGEKKEFGVLNLNHSELVKGRMYAVNSIRKLLGRSPGSRTRVEVSRLIRNIKGKNVWPEYAGVMIYYLQKKLNRM